MKAFLALCVVIAVVASTDGGKTPEHVGASSPRHVVTFSGGGYRSALMTIDILTAIGASERELELHGLSGGAWGLSAYDANFDPGNPEDRKRHQDFMKKVNEEAWSPTSESWGVPLETLFATDRVFGKCVQDAMDISPWAIYSCSGMKDAMHKGLFSMLLQLSTSIRWATKKEIRPASEDHSFYSGGRLPKSTVHYHYAAYDDREAVQNAGDMMDCYFTPVDRKFHFIDPDVNAKLDVANIDDIRFCHSDFLENSKYLFTGTSIDLEIDVTDPASIDGTGTKKQLTRCVKLLAHQMLGLSGSAFDIQLNIGVMQLPEVMTPVRLVVKSNGKWTPFLKVIDMGALMNNPIHHCFQPSELWRACWIIDNSLTDDFGAAEFQRFETYARRLGFHQTASFTHVCKSVAKCEWRNSPVTLVHVPDAHSMIIWVNMFNSRYQNYAASEWPTSKMIYSPHDIMRFRDMFKDEVSFVKENFDTINRMAANGNVHSILKVVERKFPFVDPSRDRSNRKQAPRTSQFGKWLSRILQGIKEGDN